MELYKSTGPVSKVNAPLVSGGDVTSFAISPDRNWIAYAVDQDMPTVVEIYVAAADGTGTSTKVSGAMASGGDASLSGDQESWSPDASVDLLVYTSEQETAAVIELFVADSSGAVTKVSGTLVPGGDVDPDTFVWAP